MRTARQQSVSDIYHVIGRGTGRQIIFEDDEDRNDFLSLLKAALGKTSAELYAWCLMDNHYHLLIRAPLDQLSLCMKTLASAYALRFNAKHDRTGHLFQDRFKSEPVNDDAYLLSAVRYIHKNPEKAGICACERYRWSSYGEYAGAPRLCSTAFVLDAFGGIGEFEAFHRSSEGERCLDVEDLRSATRSMPDAKAVELAARVLDDQGIGTAQVRALGKAQRNAALKALKQAGLSIKQIERMTGVSRSTIQRA